MGSSTVKEGEWAGFKARPGQVMAAGAGAPVVALGLCIARLLMRQGVGCLGFACMALGPVRASCASGMHRLPCRASDSPPPPG